MNAIEGNGLLCSCPVYRGKDQIEYFKKKITVYKNFLDTILERLDDVDE